MKNKLNDAIAEGQRKYDVSIPRQKKAVDAINEGIAKLREVCKKYNREMPTQIKITYDVVNNKLRADCSYELFFTNHRSKTAYDILQKWFDEEKNRKC